MDFSAMRRNKATTFVATHGDATVPEGPRDNRHEAPNDAGARTRRRRPFPFPPPNEGVT